VKEPTTSAAIHGLVRWVAWSVVEREPHRVVVGQHLHPQPGYPFALAIRIEYVLSVDGLRALKTATNIGGDPCPFGAGAHPYLRPGSPVLTLHRCISLLEAFSRSTRTGFPPASPLSRKQSSSSTFCARGRSAERNSTIASSIFRPTTTA
jgi:galactose mutarotase-like enzyme